MEIAEVYWERKRKARKDHKGVGGALIKKGTEYKYVSGIFDGEPFDFKINLKLAQFIDEYNSKLNWDNRICYEDILEIDWNVEELFKIRKIYSEEGSYGSWFSHLSNRIDRQIWGKKEEEYLKRIEELEEKIKNYETI